MNIVEIINKKRTNKVLTKDEINFVINGYLKDEVKDYQMSALLMAICINGMNNQEIVDLTNTMINSGEILDLSLINGIKVDKHSSGGVGDKTSLIVLPLVASCLVPVAKMSGRGLGHTGGTVDKLESIPGFKSSLTKEEFINQVNTILIADTSQNNNLVPADKKLYSLRDITGTTESIPLIASSIMSKKIASGADKILLDIKVGNGAFIKNLDEAKELANLMVNIGKSFNKETIAIISNMNQPLGNTVGNSLEIIEAYNTLNNKGPKDLENLCIEIASYMVSLGKNIDVEAARQLVITKLKDNSGLNKFIEWISYQGGNLNELKVANNTMEVKINNNGYIKSIDTYKIGMLCGELGASRLTKDDLIDYNVGMIINKKIGDYVNLNDTIVTIYYNDKQIDINEVINCFEIGEEPIKEPLIYDVIK
jgi:pyrimidine-nucleoside phosphorylase